MLGDAEAAGDLVHPGVQRRIEILPRPRLADGRALQDEERDRQEGDGSHLLIDVLRHRIEGGGRHEADHEQHRHRAQRKRDGHAEEHGAEGGPAIEEADESRALVPPLPEVRREPE